MSFDLTLRPAIGTGAAASAPAPPSGTAGSPIGLLLLLTQAS